MAKRRYTVVFSGKMDRKVSVIKSIFRYTSLGLRESKELLDKTIERGVESSVETQKKKNAEALVQELKDAGLDARYEVNSHGLCLVEGDTHHEI